MTAGDRHLLLRTAIAAVRDCADTMDRCAAGLLEALPTVAIDAGLRANAMELIAGLKDASNRVTFELAVLHAELGLNKANAATVVRSLSSMDATMMGALASVAEVVDQLESAAERDSRQERAFVLMIEAAGVMLQGLEKAKAATEALGAAMAATEGT